MSEEPCVEELIDLMKEPFTDYFHEGIKKKEKEIKEEWLMEFLIELIEDNMVDVEECLDLLFPKESRIIKSSSTNNDEIIDFIISRLDEISLLRLAKTYFTLYPTHGEVAGAVFGFLYKKKAKKEIKELLEVIKKHNPEFFWDT